MKVKLIISKIPKPYEPIIGYHITIPDSELAQRSIGSVVDTVARRLVHEICAELDRQDQKHREEGR